MLRKSPRSFILVDGLDEMVHAEGEKRIVKSIDILDDLYTVMQDVNSCSMFLTSRDQSLALEPKVDAMYLPIKGTDDDIRLLIKERINDKSFSHSERVRENKDNESYFLKKLETKWNGQLVGSSSRYVGK